MTFDEAMLAARKGKTVCDPSWMSPGWKIIYYRKFVQYFALNPHTGSDYQYMPTDAHKASTTWEIAP
jgi:hypothetical protein